MIRHFLITAALVCVTSAGIITTSVNPPTTNLLSASAGGGTDTALFDEDANANHARGQLFTLGSSNGSSFEISAITIKKSTTQFFTNDLLTLRIFAGDETQWNSGSGHSTAIDGNDYYVDATVSPLHTEVFTLNETLSDNHYLTFEFTSPIVIPEGVNFGFLMTYDRSSPSNPDRLRHRESGSGGGRISITDSNHGTSPSRRIVYFVQGSEVPPADLLELAPPFQSGMVLQRGKPIKIWGEANPDSPVEITFNDISRLTTADPTGKWQLEFPAMNAGGPFVLTATSGETTAILDDILIGDVWLAFGQSNMVRPLSEMTGRDFYLNEIEQNQVPVRCLKVTQYGALTPQDNPTIPTGHYVNGAMNWLAPSTSGSWTSVGTVFAYRMYEATGVPTAIIWAAWGSSSIEGWMPREVAEKLPYSADLLPDYYAINSPGSVDNYASSNGFATNTAALESLLATGWGGSPSTPDIFVRTRPNILYNQMIHPLVDLGISGFVWYQGEANTSNIQNTAAYGFSLPALVTEYRSRFQQGDLPFLGVQLPSYNNSRWPWFREAQNQLEILPNAYVAVTIDTGSTNNIHPVDKEPIGIRLSLLARKHALGEAIEAIGPRFSQLSISGNTATLSFTNATGLTTNDALPPATFEVAGADQVFHPATSAAINGSTITVSATSEPQPVAVRYAWSAGPVNQVNLVNSVGLPAAPFRTDSWPISGLGARAPRAVPDSYQTPRDQSLIVPANGIMANDIDLNRDPLTAILVDDVSSGTLALLADGSFTYTPEEGYAGPDSFSYRSNDGSQNSETTTVSLEVTGNSTSYFLWKSNVPWSPDDDDSLDGDPDSDGIKNFLEFALGLNPISPDSSGLPVLSQDQNDYLFDFNPARPELTYEVQLSPDLVTWSDPSFATIADPTETPLVIPASEEENGRLFVRLRVSEK